MRPIDRLVAWIRRLLKKPADPGDSPSQRFLDIVADAVGTRWLRLMLTTLSYHLSLYVALLVSLSAVRVASDTVHWAEVLAAFSLVRLISAIPITPGALGVIEVGLTGLLTTDLDDSEAALVAAAVFCSIDSSPTLCRRSRAPSWRSHGIDRKQKACDRDDGGLLPRAL